MGRSGTSLTTRALGLHGLYLGEDDDMMPPADANPRGYWEHMDVFHLNEELLAHLGGSWFEPPMLTPGWEHDPSVEPFLIRAQEIAARLGEGGRRWAFKDPRTVVTLPLWTRACGPFDFIICVREPAAVIDSAVLTGVPADQRSATAALWLDMNALALTHTVGARRAFVFYEDWFTDPRAVVDHLCGFLHGPGRYDRATEAAEATLAFFEPGLRRQQGQGESRDLSAGAPAALYELMRSVSEDDTSRRQRTRTAALARQIARSSVSDRSSVV